MRVEGEIQIPLYLLQCITLLLIEELYRLKSKLSFEKATLKQYIIQLFHCISPSNQNDRTCVCLVTPLEMRGIFLIALVEMSEAECLSERLDIVR